MFGAPVVDPYMQEAVTNTMSCWLLTFSIAKTWLGIFIGAIASSITYQSMQIEGLSKWNSDTECPTWYHARREYQDGASWDEHMS